MTHPRNAPPAGADAERAAFLRDLRALRDQAGLQTRDLAARAHYPEDTLKTAEDGPALPTLPVLEAYVRGCGARPSDWEDRWRRLTLPEEADVGSALPTRAPTADRLPTRDASAGPVGLSAAEQAALAPGLARVAAGLAPTTVAADTGSWFARPDLAASGSAAPPTSAPPTPSAPSAPSAPSGAGQAVPEGGAAWHRPDPGSAWPPADSGTARPPADSGTARPTEKDRPWAPATDGSTAWPATDNGTAWPATERGTARTGPGESGPTRTASGGSGGHARAQKPTSRLKASELPAESEPARRPSRRAMTGIILSLTALLVVAAVLWLALAS